MLVPGKDYLLPLKEGLCGKSFSMALFEVAFMKDEGIKKILAESRTIAVVGISPREDRPSYQVACYLQSHGYRILPVRPEGETILGEKIYRNLSDIPPEIGVDVVDVLSPCLISSPESFSCRCTVLCRTSFSRPPGSTGQWLPGEGRP